MKIVNIFIYIYSYDFIEGLIRYTSCGCMFDFNRFLISTQNFADSRVRVRGRFVKKDDQDLVKDDVGADDLDEIKVEDLEEFTSGMLSDSSI